MSRAVRQSLLLAAVILVAAAQATAEDARIGESRYLFDRLTVCQSDGACAPESPTGTPDEICQEDNFTSKAAKQGIDAKNCLAGMERLLGNRGALGQALQAEVEFQEAGGFDPALLSVTAGLRGATDAFLKALPTGTFVHATLADYHAGCPNTKAGSYAACQAAAHRACKDIMGLEGGMAFKSDLFCFAGELVTALSVADIGNDSDGATIIAAARSLCQSHGYEAGLASEVGPGTLVAACLNNVLAIDSNNLFRDVCKDTLGAKAEKVDFYPASGTNRFACAIAAAKLETQ